MTNIFFFYFFFFGGGGGGFRKGKTHIIAKFHGTELVICSHFREGKTLSYS